MLNQILQLTPLTLIEVADKHALRDAAIGHRLRPWVCPYWFFQHVHADGRLTVSSPGGGRENIDAIDIMNIIPTEPIRTMAMPSSVFLDRLCLPYSERNRSEDSKSYHPGYVMAAHRDRWANFDYNIWFDNPEFNVSSTYFAPLPAAERDRLKKLTTRQNMPVRNLSAKSNWSCDSLPLRNEAAHIKKAKLFLVAALQGKSREIEKLCVIAD